MRKDQVRKKHNPGFILPLTLSIIGLAIALVTYMVNNGRAFTPSVRTTIEREKARMLARSGIEIAMSQLSLPDKKADEKKPDDKKETKSSDDKQEETLFSFIVPRVNVWQTFKLTPKMEGIQGEIGVCLMSEEGKLNLNEFFDPANGELLEQLKKNEKIAKCIQDLFERIEKATGGKDMRKGLETFFKARKTKLDDVTELLKIPEFKVFKDAIFYEPSEKTRDSKNKEPLYLTDIFTIWSTKSTIQPWLLSDSLRGILDISRAKDTTPEEKKKIVAEILKTMPPTLAWTEGWNKNLKLLYGKDFVSLPKGVELLLDTKFEPVIFSVLCYGKVGKTTQKVFAILERVKTSTEKDKQQLNVKLKKLYWI
jgi:hypothetical protein